MREIFDRVPEGVNLTIVLDCCHSGGGIDSDHVYQPFGSAEQSNHIDPMKGINLSRELPMPADIANRGIGLDLKPKARGIKNSKNSDIGLLISGCQSHQTSADSYIGNKFMGAASYFLARNIKKYKYDISYKNLIDAMNKDLKEFEYTQRPELNGDSSLFDKKFLDKF
jgi:hypothetical protein